MFPKRIAASSLLLLFSVGLDTAFAGGPRWVAGSSYFSSSVLGRRIVWKNGILNYYTDLGDLSPTVFQAQANALVASAAALWSGIPTAAIRIHAAGSLSEDVNGSNFLLGPAGLTEPADVKSSAIGTPIGIIYDADGSVLDALEGRGASDPISCNVSGVTTLVDNFSSDATIAHALMVVNGRCATDAPHIALLQYELLRGFGRILGLDWSQANDEMFPGNTTPDGLLGWPLMHPVEKLCNSDGNPCMTGAIAPRADDVAAISRLYPVTSANAVNFPEKSVTAAATVSVQGTIRFRNGQGMQGVNVVARPLIPGTDNPDMRYPVSTVSGSLYAGNSGNPVTGALSASGRPFDEFGTTTATLEGWYDLSAIPLPPGATQADYQVTFEPVNPLYTGEESVGPYTLGQVKPSGTMPIAILRGLTAGSSVLQNITIADSARDMNSGGDGTQTEPVAVPRGGEWSARLSGYGHSSWLRWRMRGGRQATVEGQPTDEGGLETSNKARLVIGVWNGDDPLSIAPDVVAPQPFNAIPNGLTTLSFESGNDGDVRIALADQRGDGRPDYLYRGRVLYADTVKPRRLPVSGGPIVIEGMGFSPGDIVTVGGAAAAVASASPSEITAIAPASIAGATGNVAVTVTDPITQGWSTIEASSGTSLSYDSGGGDRIVVVEEPPNSIAVGAPLPFTVRAIDGGGSPASGLSVTYAVTQGAASLGCGRNVCVVFTAGDGLASILVSAINTAPAVVTASLTNGAGAQASFSGATYPSIAALTGTLHLAAGAVFDWMPQAIVLSNGVPFAGQTVSWTGSASAAVASSKTTSDANGMASTQIAAGPLAIAATTTVNACVTVGQNGRGCVAFPIVGVDPASASLTIVSGNGQDTIASDPPQPLVLRVRDPAGDFLAGATVNFYETLRLWAPPCPAEGRCPPAPVLQRQTVQALSDENGFVTLNPLTDGVLATRLTVFAVAGDDGAITASIERLPSPYSSDQDSPWHHGWQRHARSH